MAEAKEKVSLQEILSSIYISDIIQSQKLLSVTEGDSVSTAAALLSTNNISSVPVFNASADCKIDNCLGIVDFADIASVLIDLRKKGYNEADPRKHIWNKMGSMSVKEAIKFNESKYVQVSVKDPVLEAVEKCAEFSFRRMLAVDEDGTIVGVISPSEIIKQILDAVGTKGEDTLDMNLRDLTVGSAPVITVAKQQPLERAFSLMNEHMVTAIGVVETKTDVLQASISVSDVCLLLEEENSGLLKSSAWKFITHKKEKEVDAVFPFFSVKETATLKSAMARLLATSVHHLYVIDDKSKPTKVVGFADVCRGMLSYKSYKK